MKSTMLLRLFGGLLLAPLIASCGGGGGGGSGASSTPTVSLSAVPSTVNVGQAATLSWSTTNVSSCNASDGWAGAKATSGTEQTTTLIATTSFTLTCSGNGGSVSQSAIVTVASIPGGVTITGRITFDRIGFKPVANAGLNPSVPIESPARHVVVEAIESGTNAVLASTTTDALGNYSVVVPANRSLFIRASAQMLKSGGAPTWNFRVLNNMNSDALYVLDGAIFTSSANTTRDLRAPSGWGATDYTGTRAAAPFAILDTIYQAKELTLSAAPAAAFPALDLFWSVNNRDSTEFCPDQGNIRTSLYLTAGPNETDDCATPTLLAPGIYILGEFANGGGDTDEFDQHVIAHEFGHYLEDKFSRSDSIGGEHSLTQRLDLRLAFGEGWGNAHAAMTLNDPAYRDSFQGVTADGGFNVETDSTTAEGWFSESSVGEILWDVFDPANEPGDTVPLGFAPIFATLTGTQVSSDALTSIYSFAAGLRSARPNDSAAIGTLLGNESVFGSGDFAQGESNSGTDVDALPVYRDISVGVPLTGVCTRATSSGSVDLNKLGNRRFLRLTLGSARVVNIQVTGVAPNAQSAAATDPDIFVHRKGVVVAFSEGEAPNVETISQLSLAAGTYIIEVYDYQLSSSGSTPRCMNVSITG